MKTFFDTSTLIASLVANEAAHPAADAAFCAARHRMASVHSIAECFAQLTGKLRFAPADAAQLIKEGLPDMHWHVLPAAEMLAVTAGASALGVRGGLIYDALIVATARHAKAGLILTGNRAHFLQCAPDLADIIREP